MSGCGGCFFFLISKIGLNRKVSWEAPEQSIRKTFLLLQSVTFTSKGCFDVQLIRIRIFFLCPVAL